MNKVYLIENLNNHDKNIRLKSLQELMQLIENGEIERPVKSRDVNNHIHTSYSFSPYSPTKAIWAAYNAGLSTAGIIDHDSISGAVEFIEAGKIVGMATTIGIECRADFSKTSLNGRRINNPDQNTIAYTTLHGIPHTQIENVKVFLKTYSNYRNDRNRRMVDKINELFSPLDINLCFNNDVIPVSYFDDGGSITERHILYSLSLKLINKYGKGKELLDVLKANFNIKVSPKIENYLLDETNQNYAYDLLGLLKGEIVKSFYIDASIECPDVKEVIAFANSIGAISAYAYLGDVGYSVTGDKATQEFEDSYLDILFITLKELNFNAVTYMPSRNSMQQLEKVKAFCDKYGFLQISGEDINSPRQSFICEPMRSGKFDNLIETTWALIGHELAATKQISRSMFSSKTILEYSSLEDRIKIYSKIGRALGID